MSPRLGVIAESAWHRVPGGTHRAFAATLDALVGLDRFRVTGIAAAHRERRDLPIPVRHHRLPRPALYEAWHHLGRPSVAGGPYDVIWSPAVVVPPRSASSTDAPMVVTVHDVDFLDHPEYLSRRGRWFHPKAFAVACERADRLVVPSSVVADAVVGHGADPARVRVVPWGVDPIEPEAEPGRLPAGLPSRFVLWVGTVEPRKNLGRLVEAMAHNGVDLVVVGPDGWELDGRDVLAPLGDRVHRLGFVDDAELRALYAAATVFVFPSLAEGFGLPVLEAMAAGTPVVTSAGTATEEVAAGAARLVDPTDVASIAAAIEEVVGDDEVRASLVSAGSARAASATWGATAEGYARVFEELVSGGKTA